MNFSSGIYGIGISLTILSVSGLIITGFGALILFPTLIGFGIYRFYKKNKNEKYKSFLESLKD